jgi:redox-sensitive bicupin YhaK (pirin superfamily)
MADRNPKRPRMYARCGRIGAQSPGGPWAPRRLGRGTKTFPRDNTGLSVLASGRPPDASSDALKLHAGAAVLAGTWAEGQTTELTLASGRAAYLVAVNGSVTVNGLVVNARDGVAILDERTMTITATRATGIVVMDVAA